MSDEIVGQCANCRFWDNSIIEVKTTGVCRRFPPVACAVDDDECLTFPSWPLTHDDEWCGEWQIIPEFTIKD